MDAYIHPVSWSPFMLFLYTFIYHLLIYVIQPINILFFHLCSTNDNLFSFAPPLMIQTTINKKNHMKNSTGSNNFSCVTPKLKSNNISKLQANQVI